MKKLDRVANALADARERFRLLEHEHGVTQHLDLDVEGCEMLLRLQGKVVVRIAIPPHMAVEEAILSLVDRLEERFEHLLHPALRAHPPPW